MADEDKVDIEAMRAAQESETGVNDDSEDEAGETETGDEDSGQDERDYEADARRMGWIPKDEFKGDESEWTDAKTFVERGEHLLPILNARNRKLLQRMERLEGMEREFEATRKVMKTLQSEREKDREEAYQRALDDIRAEQRKAAEEGDLETYDRLDERAKSLKRPEAKTDEADDDTAPKGPSPAMKAWLSENAWYENDLELGAYVDMIAPRLAKQNQDSGRTMTEADFYAELSRLTKERFPDKFENPNRNKPAPVSGGRRSPGNGAGGGFNALPAEARRAFKRFAEDGIYQDDEKGRAKYAKAYFSQENAA